MWLEHGLRDVRYAARRLRNAPGFTAVAVLSLALAIGANTALFSLVDDVLLRSLPVANPHELVLFRWLSAPDGLIRGVDGTITTDPVTGLRSSTSMSHLVFERLRDRPEMLRDIFAFAGFEQLNVIADGQAEITTGQVVSGDYFRALGVSAIRGRVLTGEDDRPAAPPVAVISYEYWQRRFGGRDDVLGRTVRVNGVPVAIVGMTARGFRGALEVGATPAFTLPLALDPQLRGGPSNLEKPLLSWLHIMGRLRAGVAPDQARAALEGVFVQALQDAWRAAPAGESRPSLDRNLPSLGVDPGAQGLVDARRRYAEPLRLLMGIVGLVLVISCANVANLLLARGAGRQRENAVRLSIGATRRRLIREALTESLLIALLGGLLGVLVAFWGRDALLHLRPLGAAPLGPLDLNLRVLAFTAAVSLLTGLVFGTAPAWRATRLDLNLALKADRSQGRSRFGLRGGVIVAQVALSVVLLVGAGLFVRTLQNLRHAETGFNGENLVLFRVHAGLNGYRGPQVTGLFDRLIERLEALPGVRSVAVSRHPLLSGSRRTSGISLDRGRASSGPGMGVAVNCVTPGFLTAMEIPLLAGRDIARGDREGAPRVALVNETFARKFFPGESALGRTFSFGPFQPDRRIEIVGLVRDALYYNVRGGVPATVFVPFHQDASEQGNVAVRTAGDPEALAAAIRTALHEVDPDVPLFDLRTQEEQVGLLVAQERLFAALCTVFGLVAVLLTSIGLYGLLAQHVITRTKEIGIRIALGAEARKVLALVLGQGLRLTVLGLALGLGAAYALTPAVARLLFEVQPSDPATLLGVSLLLMGMALLACWWPARRATRVDPMVALRCD